MGLTLTKLTHMIDDCLEDGKQIGIIANKELAEFIQAYLGEYDMVEKLSVLSDAIHLPYKSDEYLIMINCKDNDYNYYIFYYKLNDKILVGFDELYICSDKVFVGFDRKTITSRLYSFHGNIEMTNDEVYELLGYYEEEDESPITQEEHDRWVRAEEGCPVCCVDCSDYDCEYQGNVDDCDCDDCYEYKEYVKNDMDNMDHMDTESDEHSELDREDYEEYVRETLPEDMDDRTKDLLTQLSYYSEMVKNACSQKCLLKILASLHEEVSEQAWHDGWNGCKEYVKESLEL